MEKSAHKGVQDGSEFLGEGEEAAIGGRLLIAQVVDELRSR
jgi:hypothetical protein